VLNGTTAVGGFHYLHHAPNGHPYSDPNLLGKTILRAAQSVGLRIALLRVAYFRAGYDLPRDPGQIRFYESLQEYLDNTSAMAGDVARTSSLASIGVAPHSIRAVPLDELKEIAAWAEKRNFPIHMHMAEQPAENEACRKEYGQSPIQLLATQNLLSDRLTLVHAVHTTEEELEAIATARGIICSCPTTERNLGDGIIAADKAICRGIRFCFGSDSQAQIDPLEDARELEYHLRLIHRQRVILDEFQGVDLSARLFSYATEGGALSLGINAGVLQPGKMADFFTIDLNDPSIAGSSEAELLPMVVFALSRSAIRDVFVGGRKILSDGCHEAQEEILAHYQETHRKVWKNGGLR
jgi:formimidoylglutamate deiminase